jgi:hypothetical protein
MGLDRKSWILQVIPEPGKTLPEIIVGPYKGWSLFFDNQLNTTFAKALEIPEFFQWCKTHDRIIPLSQHFPLPTNLILLRSPEGKLIHIEGGHRICAAAYGQKLGEPIQFDSNRPVSAAVAEVTLEEIQYLINLIPQGTDK